MYLIDIKFGLCVSYSEVSAANQLGTDLYDSDIDLLCSISIQSPAENVNQNSDTSDGLNTFHYMCIIACITVLLPAIKRTTIESS